MCIKDFKEWIMKILQAKGFALILPLVIIVAAAIIGYSAHHFTHKDDGELEEAAETVIEEELETTLDLPKGSKKGTIDLTPDSKETK